MPLPLAIVLHSSPWCLHTIPQIHQLPANSSDIMQVRTIRWRVYVTVDMKGHSCYVMQ